MESYSYDSLINFEPLIKNLEFIITDLNNNTNNNKFASLIFPAAQFYPKISKKKNIVEHKTPFKYLEEKSESEFSNLLGVVMKNTILSLEINSNQIISNEISIPQLKEYWLFDEKKYNYSIKYQVLELGQILIVNNSELSKEKIVFLVKEFYTNFKPYYNKEDLILDSNLLYYKGFNQVIPKINFQENPEENPLYLKLLEIFQL